MDNLAHKLNFERARTISVDCELELLLCCARMVVSDEITLRIERLICSDIDWQKFIKLSLRHGVTTLVYATLNERFADRVPTDALREMRGHFHRNMLRAERLTAELRRLLNLFAERDAAINAVPYKGSVLARAAYGEVSFRQFTDIDLMIEREDVTEATGLLLAEGYQLEHALSVRDEEAFRRIQCEHTFHHAEKNFYIDLHWDFVPSFFPVKPDLRAMRGRLVSVELQGERVATFAPEDVLIVLALNAGKEFWNRLLSICDVAELIRAHPQLDWSQVLERAKESHLSRMLFVSLILANRLLDAPLTDEVRAAISSDRKADEIAARVVGEMSEGAGFRAEIKDVLRVTNLFERRRDRALYRLRLALTPTQEDWRFVSLPERLSSFYYLLRPLRLAKKYLLRGD